MKSEAIPGQSPQVQQRLEQVTIAGFLLLWFLTTGALLRRPTNESPVFPVIPVQCTINPNTATWWELAVLPRIGEGVARRIVAYRASVDQSDQPMAEPAFRSAADLALVRGIGPKTLLHIGPYLRFDHRGTLPVASH